MQLAWLTDIHLNFVKPDDRQTFYASVREAQPDAVLLSGDIAEAPTIIEYLTEIERGLKVPVYFVLGNHDFYRSSFSIVEKRVREVPSNLIWLTASDVQWLGEDTALVGDDGCADGRFGNFEASPIFLNDYLLINEFVGLEKPARLRLMNHLGDAAAARIKPKLHAACTQRKRVILVTHVPPFRESCRYNGKISDDDWLPHMSSKAMGDAIIEVMDQYPECKLQVLCGHTHGEAMVQIRPNITAVTGGAQYGRPAIQSIVEVY